MSCKRTGRLAALALSLPLLYCIADPPPPPSRDVARAEVELARGDAVAAVEWFEVARAVDPRDERATRGLAAALLARAGPGDAEAALMTLAELEPAERYAPTDLECRASLAAARTQLVPGQAERVLALLDGRASNGCAVSGDVVLRARAQSHQGRDALATGDTEAALELFAQARATDPELVESYVGTGRALLAAGRESVVPFLAHALERHPRNRGLQQLMVEALGVRYPEPAPALQPIAPTEGPAEPESAQTGESPHE